MNLPTYLQSRQWKSNIAGKRLAVLGATLGVGVLLTGCYVVPIEPHRYPGSHHPHAAPVVVAPAAPAPVTFAARLYPANEIAARHGMVQAVVTNDLNGRGTFSTNISGEQFSGEATRQSAAARSGIANGSGNRGSYIRCQYTMNSATLGAGSCQLSDGAVFNMHVGG